MFTSNLDDLPELLTYDQVSQFLNVSRQSVKKWVKAGRFPEPIDLFGPRFKKADVVAIVRGEWIAKSQINQ